jgi:dynein light chain LC8-type
MTDRKAVIKNADMSEEMQQDAVDCATQAMEKYNIEKDIAAFIKREFDKKYNPTWHCIVGRNFGSYVTHETKVRNGGFSSNPCSISSTFTSAKSLFCYSRFAFLLFNTC